MIKIVHLRHKCIGCNACVESSPDHWVMSKTDGKSYLKKSTQKGKYYILELPEWERDAQQEAARNCPVKIITVRKN
ncbi:MAG: ferredoxin [Cyclobacteriaceae bacterium]|nr:ferredoxin [Cyclobacteriaceae bacterium]